MSSVLSIDHLVINAHFELEGLAKIFTALGFHLTPLGRHPMGSINHLAVFDHTYLELIGLPTDTRQLREEIVKSPLGIDGLVFATENAQATYDAWNEAGFRTTQVQEFSRDVFIDGVWQKASFRTVRLLPGQIAAGRVYACEQRTPQWIWRPTWQQHDEPIVDLFGLVIVSSQPKGLAQTLSRLGNLEHPYRLETITRGEFTQRYGDVTIFSPDRREFFAALLVQVGEFDGILARAQKIAVPYSVISNGHRAVLALPAFHTLLVLERK